MREPLVARHLLEAASDDAAPMPSSSAIQPHGVLLAVREGDLVVRWASANTGEHLGIAPGDVLGARLGEVLGAWSEQQLVAELREPPSSGSDPLLLRLPDGPAFEATWHRTDDLVIIELEPVAVSEDGSMADPFADVRQAMAALETSGSLQTLCDRLATEIHRLTGYDRVLVYRFHADDHGEVVSEERRPDQDAYLGLHYPASEIPARARRLLLLNPVRAIADVAHEPVPLLAARQDQDIPGARPAPLDLTLSTLRSVSPARVQYLEKRGVGASLTITLLHGTRLWGILTCHHDFPKRVDARLRAACGVLAQVFSLRIVASERQERHAYRDHLAGLEAQLLARVSGAASLAEALVLMEPSALRLTGADGMVARIDGQTVALGAAPPAVVVDALLARLGEESEAGALVWDDLPQRLPELARYAPLASGVLAVAITAAYRDFVMWFRGERMVDRRWAGTAQKSPFPRQRPSTNHPGSARPGAGPAFGTVARQDRGHCLPWVQAEVDTALSVAAAVPGLLLARARGRLAHLALHDPLTGLPNRALLLDRGAQALAWRDHSGGRVSMLSVDLDGFRLVNDSLGNAAGDDLLQQAAARLLEVTQETDTVARLGGDEFAVLSEDQSLADAQRLCDLVVGSFQAPFVLGGQETLVTASVGVAVADADMSPGTLLQDASMARQQAKHSGRNAAEALTLETRDVSLRRVEVETHLRSALEHDDLRLYFQPILDTSGTLRGFEGLARWTLAGRGMVPPTEFIPVAVSTGLIGALTDWALEVGLQALGRWRGARPDLNLTLAINITASQMGNENLQRTIDVALERNGLPADCLCLEITESALVTHGAGSRSFLEGLRKRGVLLSVDDFGTGGSSLSSLTKLPVQELKVDRSLVAGLPGRARDMAVVASVVGVAHQLGLRALAEGVESEEQLAAVDLLGCDAIQGFLLGRPMPADEIDRYLAGLAPPT